MDSVIAKAIVSRKKSIASIEAEMNALLTKSSFATSPSAVLVLKDMVKVKEQRVAKLRAELAGLEELAAAAQPELPGVAKGGRRST